MSAYQVLTGLENGRHDRGYPRHSLWVPLVWSDEQLEHFREQWNALAGGADKRWNLPILSSPTSVEVIQPGAAR